MRKYEGRDWKSQSRLKISIETENFKPGLNFPENFTRSIGINFIQSQGPLGLGRFGYFLFFSARGRGEGGVRGAGGGGSDFLLKITGRGGVSRADGGRGARGREGVCREFGGGGG